MILKNVPISNLSSHPLNDEIYMGNMDIDDLMENIKQIGLLEPLVVIKSGKPKSYLVLSGNRRLICLQRLNYEKTDVKLIEVEKDDIPLFIISYNRTRLKKVTTLLREIDILEKYYYTSKEIKNDVVTNAELIKGDKRKVISKRIGIAEGQISKLKTIRSIRPDLLEKIESDEISISQAHILCKRETQEDQSITPNFIRGKKNTTKGLFNIFCKSSVDMSEIPDERINAIICSPVFYRHRIYSKKTNEHGNEENVEDYISKVCDVMDECFRVLSKSGVMFVHLGNTYDKKGSLMNIPHRIMIEMMKRKPFLLINEICVRKVNPIPNSVKTRLSTSHEIVFFITKSKKYNFNHFRIKSKTENKGTTAPYHRGNQSGYSPYLSDGKKNLQDYWDSEMLDIISTPVANQIKSKKQFNILHPCPFPEDLRRSLLALVTPNLTPTNRIKDMSDFHLLDPYCGLSGVLFDGYILGMSVWGYDTNSNYTKVVIKEFERLSKV
jgi:DNA modification methylase/ParB-like chromosome segregation protein Spo0J